MNREGLNRSPSREEDEHESSYRIAWLKTAGLVEFRQLVGAGICIFLVLIGASSCQVAQGAKEYLEHAYDQAHH
jgi:hypothetical protein